MFIYIMYKDAPELSYRSRTSLDSVDTAVEKSLLVNPECPVRIMLEYIRKKCRLGTFTQFDLCDENGVLMWLFGLNSYDYATDQFDHKKTYYLIVIKMDIDNRYTVLPQLNQENKLYLELHTKVLKCLLTSSNSITPPSGASPVVGKAVSPDKSIASKKKPVKK